MKKLIVLMLACACFACKSNNNGMTEFSNDNVEPVVMEVIDLGDDYLLSAGPMMILNDTLINLSRNPNGVFDLFALPEVKYLGSCGMTGRAANEFNFVNQRCTNVSNGRLAVFGSNSYDIVGFGVDDNGKLTVNKLSSVKIPSQYYISNSMVMTSDTMTVIYPTNTDNQEFVAFNTETGAVRVLTSYPDLHADPQIPSEPLSTMYSNHVVSNPDNNSFAAVYTQYPMVTIFDSAGNITSTSILDNWHDQRVVYRDGGIMSSEMIQYYLTGAANQNYICGLYLGKGGEELSSVRPEDVHPEIHIWNWKGELVKSLALDRFVNNIAIDRNNVIYATSALIPNQIYTVKVE